MVDVNELVDMLRYCRPAGSDTEEKFIKKFIEPLEVTRDEFGNLYKFVGETSDILWSSHTDTVHKNEGMQNVILKNGFALASDRNCLGADCTTGVWLMMNMIRNNVPGVYIFHRAEEIGIKGSGYISKFYNEDLRMLKGAIAFDRYGYKSIITHQMGQRGCSQTFVDSLAPLLDLDYKADDGGAYTDTYSYIEQISECTNISVGYFDQHTIREKQDLIFAETLSQKLNVFDETKLVFARDPSVVEYDEYDWIRQYYDKQNDYKSGSYYDDQLWNMAELIRQYPEEAAKLLLDNNVSEEDILGTYVHKKTNRLG